MLIYYQINIFTLLKIIACLERVYLMHISKILPHSYLKSQPS
jgi:hypothetical protein